MKTLKIIVTAILLVISPSIIIASPHSKEVKHLLRFQKVKQQVAFRIPPSPVVEEHIYPSREGMNYCMLPGAVATASSTHTGFSKESAIDGDRVGDFCGANGNQKPCWGNDGGWNDDTYTVFPDWFRVDFPGTRQYSVGRIVITTFQDNFSSHHVEPYLGLQVGNNYTIEDFNIEVCTNCNGSEDENGNWVEVADQEENIDIIREYKFQPITATAVRVNVFESYVDYSRIVELEVYAK